MTDITAQAAALTLLDFERAWASTSCPACAAEKWENSPFCRRCSIRLQRARMMNLFSRLHLHKHSAEIIRRWCQSHGELLTFAGLVRHWDRCLDYLVTACGVRK